MILGECYSDPTQTEVDPTKKRYTGILQHFPDFNIHIFRRKLFIEAGRRLGVDLIMKVETKKRFFDKHAISFPIPERPNDKIFKYKTI